MKNIASEDILLEFLEAGLIDIKGDDEKLEKLQAVTQTLSEDLIKNPKLTLPYILAALDHEVSVDNEVVVKVLEALKESWKTYRNTFKDTPTQVVRAILVEALAKAMPSNDHIALIISLCIRNILPHRPLSHEQFIWESLLFSAGSQVDTRAVQEWTVPSEIQLKQFAVEQLETIKVEQQVASANAKDIELDCIAAVSSSYHNGSRSVPVENGNTYNPAQNGYFPYWAADFGPKMSNVIASTINKAIDESAVEDVDLSVPIKNISDTLGIYLSSTFQSFSSANAGLERRTNLLWWKEALYSTSTGMSYREFEKPSAAALMAFDLYQQLPCFSPTSATAFLYETVQSLSETNKKETYPVVELINAIKQDVKLKPMKEVLSELLPTSLNRGLIVSLLDREESETQLDVDALAKNLGIQGDTEITASDWAKWIFSDLTILRAASEIEAQKGKNTRKRKK